MERLTGSDAYPGDGLPASGARVTTDRPRVLYAELPEIMSRREAISFLS